VPAHEPHKHSTEYEHERNYLFFGEPRISRDFFFVYDVPFLLLFQSFGDELVFSYRAEERYQHNYHNARESEEKREVRLVSLFSEKRIKNNRSETARSAHKGYYSVGLRTQRLGSHVRHE